MVHIHPTLNHLTAVTARHLIMNPERMQKIFHPLASHRSRVRGCRTVGVSPILGSFVAATQANVKTGTGWAPKTTDLRGFRVYS